ncbi:hypothetical protein AB1Y20_006902 [Prymnesium parvum]|uniref:DNA 3'-5' helicase n=1 Tax=Prymnesium parvum TaxID=97485 RepID=A0AB34J082_PRYPA
MEAARARLAANRREQRELRAEEAQLLAQIAAAEDDAARAAEAASLAAAPPRPPATDWGGSFEWDGAVCAALASPFGHAAFRPLQREVVNATLASEDVFAVLPTGAGKSLLYHLPGVVRPGLTLVVSPLVSLMEDQVHKLLGLGVRAALLAADATDRAQAAAIQNAAADPAASGLRFLYVTPERIAKSKLLMSRLQKCHVSGQLARVAIDEAHCCSAQGHDFRPDFLALGSLRDNFPSAPILALTATASDAVRADVQAILQMRRVVCFRGHFDRTNLRYEVRPKPAEPALLDEMAAVCRRHGGGGIVYTLSRADAEKVAGGLVERGVVAAAYHAGCDSAQRRSLQAAWQAGAAQVVVATIAFGLGIDKPDVRFVLHHTMSKSLEAYYQESGRAGRDGVDAEVIAWWKPSDMYRLASLACESRDRSAAMAQLMAAASYCEAPASCRREAFSTLFQQPVHQCWADGARRRRRCCDNCAAPPAEAAGAEALARGGRLAVCVLRVLHDANESADGDGAAPAHLTALKLVEKAAAPLGVKVSRDELERLVLRLVLEGAVQLHFAYTAYSINTYLYVRPSLGRKLSGGVCSADELGLSTAVRASCSVPAGGKKGVADADSSVRPDTAKAAAPRSAKRKAASINSQEEQGPSCSPIVLE